jgi:hypothetical protein
MNLKGYGLTSDYWADGVFSYTTGNTYNPAHVQIVWDWTGQEASLYTYWQSSGVNYTGDYNLFMYYNGTFPGYTGGHEYRSTVATAQKKYICEASGS